MNIIEMVREAEVYATTEYTRLRNEAICEEYLDINWHEIKDERLVALARSDEREECAKLCDEIGKESLSQWPDRFANMIRARGEA